MEKPFPGSPLNGTNGGKNSETEKGGTPSPLKKMQLFRSASQVLAAGSDGKPALVREWVRTLGAHFVSITPRPPLQARGRSDAAVLDANGAGQAMEDPATLDLLKGCAIDYLLIGDEPVLAGVRKRALADGLAASAAAPPGVELVTRHLARSEDGPAWRRRAPGRPPPLGGFQRLGRAAVAGPAPRAAVWVDAAPRPGPGSPRFLPPRHRRYRPRTAGDGSSHWITPWPFPWLGGFHCTRTLGGSCRRPPVLHGAQTVLTYAPLAVIGVISSFTGDDQFFGQEMLNLLGRVGCHYRVLPRALLRMAPSRPCAPFLYTDAETALRRSAQTRTRFVAAAAC